MAHKNLAEKYKNLHDLGLNIQDLQKKYDEDALKYASLVKPCSKEKLEKMIESEGVTDEVMAKFHLLMLPFAINRKHVTGIWGDLEEPVHIMNKTLPHFYVSVDYNAEGVTFNIQLETKKHHHPMDSLTIDLTLRYVDLLEGKIILPEQVTVDLKFNSHEIYKNSAKMIHNILREIVKNRNKLPLYNTGLVQ